MAFDLFGGSASSTDQRTAVTDQGSATRGNQSPVLQSGAVNLGGQNAKIISPNSVDAANSKDFTAGNRNTVTAATGSQVSINDPATAQQAISAVQTLASQFGTKLTDLITTTGTQQANSQDKTLSAIAALAQNSQASGSGATVQPVANAADPTQTSSWFSSLSNTQKLIGAAIAAAVLIIVFGIFRRNK